MGRATQDASVEANIMLGLNCGGTCISMCGVMHIECAQVQNGYRVKYFMCVRAWKAGSGCFRV